MYFVYLMKTRLLITNFKKNQIMKIRLYFLLFGLLFVSSCRTLFRITVQEPAMIDLPNEVTKIVVVDNTQLKKLDFSTAVDEVLTGEQFNGDKEAANQCSLCCKIDGLPKPKACKNTSLHTSHNLSPKHYTTYVCWLHLAIPLKGSMSQKLEW